MVVGKLAVAGLVVRIVGRVTGIVGAFAAVIAAIMRNIKRLAAIRVSYSWGAAIFQGLAIAGAEWLLLAGAAPGVAVACLAVAAIVMAFRIVSKDFGRVEQAVWIALSAIFLFAEIRAIAADREQTARQEIVIRREERDKFEALLEQGRAINLAQKGADVEQQKKFADQRRRLSALLSQGARSIDDLSKVAASVSEATSYAGGGSSYPAVWPYELTLDDGRLYSTKAGPLPAV